MEEITESFNCANGLCSSSSGYYWLSENNGRNKVYIRETKRIILEPRLRRSVLEASNNANCHPCQLTAAYYIPPECLIIVCN